MKKSLFGKAIQRKSSASLVSAPTPVEEIEEIPSAPDPKPSTASPSSAPTPTKSHQKAPLLDSPPLSETHKRPNTNQAGGEKPAKRKKGEETPSEPEKKVVTLADLLKPPPRKGTKKKRQTEEEDSEKISDVRKELEKDAAVQASRKIETEGTGASNYRPRVRVVDGNIVIEEKSSLVMPQQSAEHSDYSIVNEQKAHVTSRSFSKFTATERWTEEETDLFFEGLRQCGTDFSLLQMLFPKRTRRQIRNKFKREEAQNPARLNAALLDKKPIETEKYCYAEKDKEEKKEGTEKDGIGEKEDQDKEPDFEFKES